MGKSTTLYDTNLLYHRRGETLRDEDPAAIIAEAERIIADEGERPRRRAEACVKKYQCLERQYTLAPKLLEQALDLQPEMPEALLERGIFYLHTGNREKALETYDMVIAAYPDYGDAYLQRGDYYKADDVEQAVADYEAYISLNPKSPLGYEGLGAIYHLLTYNSRITGKVELEYFDKAIEYYSGAIRCEPCDYSYYEERALLAMRRPAKRGEKTDDDAIIADIKAVLRLYPEDMRNNQYFTVIGNLFSRIPKTKKIRYLSKLMPGLEPNTASYWMVFKALAKAHADKGHYRKALTAYTHMITTNTPGSVWHLFGLKERAEVYKAQAAPESFTAALADYASITECGSSEEMHRVIDPASVCWMRAHIYKQQNDYENAIIEFTAVIAKAEGDDHLFRLRALIERAEIYENQGQYDKALMDQSAIIEISAVHARYHTKPAYEDLIALYRKAGDLDKAALEYRKMIELEDTGEFDNTFGFDGLLTAVDYRYKVI